MNHMKFKISGVLNNSPFTPLLGIVRTLLALSLLLTLIFNPITLLFKPVAGIEEVPVCSVLSNLTYFCLFENNDLVKAKIILIIILILIIIGFFPQVLGILHFYISFSVQNTMTIIDGGEQVTLVTTFWLMLISLFDNRLNHWQKPTARISYKSIIGWGFITVLKIQIAYIYLNAAITKLKNKEWLDGTAVYYYLNDIIFGIPDFLYNIFSFVIETPLIGLITWGTLLIQLTIFASIFANNKVKRIIFYIAIFMHEMFALFLGLVSFSLVMFAVLIFYFSPIIKDERKMLIEENN